MIKHAIFASVALAGLLFSQVKPENSKTLEEYLSRLPKNEEVIRTLVESVSTGSDMVKLHAIRALGNMKSEYAMEVLKEYVGYGLTTKFANKNPYEDYCWEIRMEAAFSLANIGSKTAVPRLEQILKMEDNYNVKKAIVYALGELHSTTSTEILIRTLENAREESLIVECVKALGKIGDKKAFLPLLTIGTGKHLPITKAEAIKALENIKW